MTLTLTVLGCSGTWPVPGNGCSGYLLQSDGATVLLDCGPGTLAEVQRHVPLGSLDAVVVTHSHPDHWVELPVLRNALKYGLNLPDAELPVFGTAETAELLETAIGRSHGGVGPTIAWVTVTDGAAFAVGDLSFWCSRTDHPVETLAVRIDDGQGRSFAFSADTGPGWSLSRFTADGLGLDLALCEATLTRDQERTVQHLSARQAGITATQAGARRLVLTHLAPGLDPAASAAEAAEVFDGPVDVARPGSVFTV